MSSLVQDEAESLLGVRVLQALTTKMTCIACKRSFTILHGGEYDCGECEHCGNTSFHTEDGRPWGYRHRYWNDWVRGHWELDDNNCITPGTLNMFYELGEIGEYLVIDQKAQKGP